MPKKLLLFLWLVMPGAVFATGNTIVLLGKRPAPESGLEDRNQDESAPSTPVWFEYDAHEHASIAPQNIFHDYNQVTHREAQCSYAFIDETRSAHLPVRVQVAEQKGSASLRRKAQYTLDLKSLLACPHCKQEFDVVDQKLLDQHMKQEHQDSNTHFCLYLDDKKQQCTKRFSSKQKLTEHENSHIGKKPYFCKHCYFNSAFSRDIVRHIERACIKKCPANKDDYMVINEATSLEDANGTLWYFDPFSKATKVTE